MASKQVPPPAKPRAGPKHIESICGRIPTVQHRQLRIVAAHRGLSLIEATEQVLVDGLSRAPELRT